MWPDLESALLTEAAPLTPHLLYLLSLLNPDLERKRRQWRPYTVMCSSALKKLFPNAKDMPLNKALLSKSSLQTIRSHLPNSNVIEVDGRGNV